VSPPTERTTDTGRRARVAPQSMDARVALARPRARSFTLRTVTTRTRAYGKHTRMTNARASTNASNANANANGYLLLTLHYVDDMGTKRAPHREAHLLGAQREYDAGRLVMAGALIDPIDSGVFVFKNVDRAHVEAFVKADAYARAGLVRAHDVRTWMVAIGN